MTFALAGIIVLAAAVIALGLLAYNLFSRLHLLEEAIAGGMRTPSRLLTREEFSRRFAVARQRAAFAAEIEHGVVLVLDRTSPTATEFANIVSHMDQRRGFVAAYVHDAPPLPDDVRVIEGLADRLDTLGIPVTPFCLIVDRSTIIEARPVGSADALDSLLLEVT